MKKKVIFPINFESFQAAEEFSNKYCRQMTSHQKMNMMQILREEHFKMIGFKNRGIQKVVRIVKMGEKS